MLTLDQLIRRGITLANRCFLCEEEDETIDHLLIHCLRARLLRDLFLAIVGSSWVVPLSVRQTLLAWQGTNIGKKMLENLDGSPSFSILDCHTGKE